MAEGGRTTDPPAVPRGASEADVEAPELLVSDALRSLLLAATIGLVGLLLAYLLVAPGGAIVPGLSALMCVAARVAAGRQRIFPRWADPAVVAIGWLLAANGLLTVALIDGTAGTVYLAVAIVGSGSLVFSYRWLALLCGGILAAWVPVGLGELDPDALFLASLGLAAASAFAFALAQARSANMRRLAAARRQQEVLRQERKAALERAEREAASRRVAQEECEKLEENLRRARASQSPVALANAVAHDMNNALTVVTTLSSALKEDPTVDGIVREDANEMLAAAEQAASLTRNLLGYAGQQKSRPEVLSLNEIVGRVEQLCGQALPEGVTVVKELQPELLPFEGDPGQIADLLVNLCVNGVQAIGDIGTLTIRTRNVGRREVREQHDLRESPAGYVELSVIDDGGGMARETLERAFEPLFSTRSRGAGAGLGLAVVRSVVEAHRGTVRLDSEAGRGTTATVRFPAVGEAPAATDGELRVGQQTATVLFVDDERSVRWVAQRVLSEHGYGVIAVADGYRAVDEFRRGKEAIDLVVLDLAMPGMSGLECSERLREVDPTARILVASGRVPGGDAEGMRETGAVGYLQKPYSATELTEAVSAALGARQ
jgi:signal transduction histidine kinase/ActR/RegA family two-component response regulator